MVRLGLLSSASGLSHGETAYCTHENRDLVHSLNVLQKLPRRLCRCGCEFSNALCPVHRDRRYLIFRFSVAFLRCRMPMFPLAKGPLNPWFTSGSKKYRVGSMTLRYSA